MKKWLINLSLVLLFPAGIFLMDGCYPNDTISIDQTDVVMTGYYDSVNFKSLSTYYMPDTIFPITDDTTNVKPINDQDKILKSIADNMAAYGYLRIYYTDSTTLPDLMLAVSAIKITTVNVGWWYPYYPGWGWGWGWGWG
ncbi:MAG TPA: hypothetical protein ENH02_07310, partial [Bacteroidetes bacterium]|nr:hypothetical protein [Bacteroidota bacterium]